VTFEGKLTKMGGAFKKKKKKKKREHNKKKRKGGASESHQKDDVPQGKGCHGLPSGGEGKAHT